MNVETFESKLELGCAAANDAATIIRRAIKDRGQACLIAATGASQFEFLDALTIQEGIEWNRTVFFHLDEYVDLPESHPASFRRYLRERIVETVRPGAFHLINGDNSDPFKECKRIGELISRYSIDAAFVGIGENGHLAFNDPPADFQTQEPYLVVELDDTCRRQQVGEGWFKNLEEVPRRAISMSISQIMRSGRVLCVVPEQRKAQAVKDCLELEVSPLRPASILREHPRATVYLDRESAALLESSYKTGPVNQSQ